MANEKPLDLSTLQAGLKRYDDSLADVAKSGDYDDLDNKPDLSPWPLTDSGSGASVQTHGCGIFGVTGEGYATQDGTPTPENPVPIEVARGRNLINCEATTSTINGVTFTVNEDGSITANGTASAQVVLNVVTSLPLNTDEFYTLSGCSGGSSSTYGLARDHFGVCYDKPVTAKPSQSDRAVYIFIRSGVTINTTFYPQLELGTTPSPYVPYGHVGLEVTHDGTTTVTPIPLPAKGFAASLPDGTADVLTVDSAGRWEWVSETNEAVFDGTESWYCNANNNFTYTTKPSDGGDFGTGASSAGKFLLDRFLVAGSGAAGTAYASGVNILFYCGGAYSPTSSAEAKAWAAANPITLLYQLATPTTEHGYIALPELPNGATVSIPELEAIGVEWWVEGIPEIGEYGRAMQTRLQEELDEAEQALSNVATTGDYNDLINKPKHNPDDINNNIFRKGIGQWDLNIMTGTSYPDNSDNTTQWIIELTQDEADIINEQADGHYSYIGGPLNYCTVRCTRDSRHQNIESIIRITRESTDIDDLQAGDVIRFTIDGQWSDYDDFWTGVDKLHIGESVNAEIFNIHTGSTFSGWTVAGSYFAQDRITAKKVTADTVGDKDGTLAELRESVLHFRTYTIDSFAITNSNGRTIPIQNIANVVTVIVVKYGTNDNSNNQMHLYSYGYDDEVLVVRFVGDNDTYMGVELGIFYTD